MTVADCEVLTLGDTLSLNHFLYLSDYNASNPSVMLICEKECDAISYFELLNNSEKPRISVRQPVEPAWDALKYITEKQGYSCRYGYDMIYFSHTVSIPCYKDLSARLLTAQDLPLIKDFKQNGGCADCHVKAIQLHFDDMGNVGMKPMGVFEKDNLICIAMPTLAGVRELKKYDIGAIFALKGISEEKAVDLMWKYAIDFCLKNGASIGNANAYEDDSPLGVALCEKTGLVKIAKNCGYYK